MNTIGIDIGGTKIAGALVDPAGRILARDRVPTDAGSAAAIEDAVVEMIGRLSAAGKELVEACEPGNPGASTAIAGDASPQGAFRAPEAVGISAAGFINAARTRVIFAPNLPWRDEPLRDRVAARTGLTVTLENDANAAGWAEYRFGLGADPATAGEDVRPQGATDPEGQMVMLTIGTGVGGAIVAGGELFSGGFGIGGELGHIRLIPDGLLCGCGAHGCLEQYGSGSALMRICGEIADGAADPAAAIPAESLEAPSGAPAAPPLGAALARAREAAGGTVRGEDVAALIAEEDPGALAALGQLGGHLGTAAASLAAVLDPRVFVIGGGVSSAGEHLLGPIRAAYRRHLPARDARPEARFVAATLGNDAGIIGAADLAARAHRAASASPRVSAAHAPLGATTGGTA